MQGFKQYLTEGFDPQGAFQYAGIWYDNGVDGIGSTPWNSNVNYMGFTAIMTPMIFAALTPPSGNDSAFLEQQIDNSKPIACPFLQVDYSDKISLPKIVGHEGRHRVKAIGRLRGMHHPIVVQWFFRGERARHYSLEDLRQIRKGAITEGSSLKAYGPLFTSNKVHFQGSWQTL